VRPIEITVRKLSRNVRASMRNCALSYRLTRKRGDVGFMIRWLNHATTYRRIAAGFLEAA